MPGVGEVLGLKKSPILESPLAGEADAAGEGDGLGLAAAVFAAFLRVRRVVGEGDAEEVAGEAAALTEGDAVAAAAFLCDRLFAGEGEAAGDSPGDGVGSPKAAQANAVMTANGNSLRSMGATLLKAG